MCRKDHTIRYGNYEHLKRDLRIESWIKLIEENNLAVNCINKLRYILKKYNGIEKRNNYTRQEKMYNKGTIKVN